MENEFQPQTIQYLTLEEAANSLKVGVETLRRYIRAGKLKAAKVGRVWRVRSDEWEAFCHRLENPSPIIKRRPRK
jgi:excisionase family DNA binding protein